ncbi:formate dehydrogenase family accessory protein FdhD [Alteromonas confluentis]|uniref:Formate dehydrogenase family accessory protein FdhD n=2 Tax=Alteromonas confluentis TaxID=1656094 RepID=A0A1E7Z745_9ALTE|nr:formate dehydrogenase family accessory protein FdhD [Alteromonas confluentis]
MAHLSRLNILHTTMTKSDSSSYDNNRLPFDDSLLVEEVPLAISVNDISLVVMMISPDDIEDFITGYFLTEQIIAAPIEIKDIRIERNETGIEANVSLTGRREHLLKSRRFARVNAGCGICNHTALEQAFPSINTHATWHHLPVCDFSTLRDAMDTHQEKARKTGALHAALFGVHNDIILGREDIGRHNALDKVIGAVRKRIDNPEEGYLVVTSRCGVELVQKAVIAGFTTLVSFSSPTSLAVSFARQHKLNLVFLPRNNQPVIFSQKVQQHGS